MAPRIVYPQAIPQVVPEMRALDRFVQQRGLIDLKLLELIRTRISQINGCAFCIDMHAKEARAAGETEQRLYALSAWRETSFFTDRERAALAWCEAITNVQDGHVPDDLYEATRSQFGEQELIDLTLAAIAMNSWNRFVLAMRYPEPGSHQVASR